MSLSQKQAAFCTFLPLLQFYLSNSAYVLRFIASQCTKFFSLFLSLLLERRFFDIIFLLWSMMMGVRPHTAIFYDVCKKKIARLQPMKKNY
jgi:hypothetical protein